MNLNKTIMMSSTKDDVSTAALKRALQAELQNKKQCEYQSYECSQLSLDGYKYCAKHILNDKNAPFKQCSYACITNGKKCHLPALKRDKKDIGYCNDHALKATLLKNRQNSKYHPPNTAEAILCSLSHYVKKPRSRTHSQQSEEGGPSSALEDHLEPKAAKSADPFTDIDAVSLYNTHCNEILSYCSESESDVEPATFKNIWHDAQGDSSDNESIDSEEDCLKHANVYTAEEITSITRDKLVKLQSLYIEEYRHLQYVLKEKRRKYLHSIKREKETCCNIYNQVRDNPKEQRLFKKLKSYNSYHKPHGVEAICTKRLHDLRAKLTDGVQKPQNFSKCLFTEGGVKCGERTLPLARHCRKHILEDPNQVLFRSCGRVRADVECNTPVEAIFDDVTCKLHADVPTIKSYSQTRKDSESDYEEPVENTYPNLLDHSQLHMSSMADIKSELSQCASEVPKMETVPTILFEDSANDDEDMETSDMLNENLDLKNTMSVSCDETKKIDLLNADQKILTEGDMEDIRFKNEIADQKLEDDTSSRIRISDIVLNEIPDEGSKSDSPMEYEDGQFDESTDTASETMSELKKDVDNKSEPCI